MMQFLRTIDMDHVGRKFLVVVKKDHAYSYVEAVG